MQSHLGSINRSQSTNQHVFQKCQKARVYEGTPNTHGKMCETYNSLGPGLNTILSYTFIVLLYLEKLAMGQVFYMVALNRGK